MATKTSTQDLANLVINRVESPTAFQQMVAAGQVNANELYLVEGDETVTYSISKLGGTITLTGSDGSTSTVTVPTATSDLTNDSGYITSSAVPSASTSTPAMDGTGAAGSSSAYARGDHVHPTDTSRAPTSHASTATTYGVGTGSNYGHLKLSDSTTSTSGTSGGVAATPSAVKAVKDAIPTATSDLTNDSGFVTEDDVFFPEIIGNADSGTTVTATSGSKTITGTATGGTFDLKIPSYGTWSVSGTVDGATASATVEVNAVKEYSVALYPAELEDASWATISAAAQEGVAANIWSVGDTKSVAVSGTVGTYEIDATIYVFILGINHSGVSGITFQGFKNANGVDMCLVSNYSTESTDGVLNFNINHWGSYNYGGWAGCDMRYDVLGSTDTAPSGYGAAPVSGSRVGYDASATTATSPVSGTLMSALPSSLRSVMRPMTIYTDNSSTGTHSAEATVTASVDYLPLAAEFEVFGVRSKANQYEQNSQSQYDYYVAGNSKVKYRYPSQYNPAVWWMRSPGFSNESSYCCVGAAGPVSTQSVSLSYGLAPIFLV